MPAEVTQDEQVVDKPDTSAAPNGEAAPEKPAGDKPVDAAAPEGGEKAKGEDAAPKTALEAAKRVMAKEGKAASEKPQDGKQPAAKEGDAKPKEGEAKPEGEEDADVPANVKSHPKYRQMSDDLRVEKRANRINKEAIAKLEPQAKVGENLTTFINSYGFTQDEFQRGLSIMAATKGDPRKAYELLAPIVDDLKARVGLVLPADLQKEVDAGTITPERAQEVSRARANSAIDRERAAATEAARARDAEERARGDEERALEAISNALNATEAEWMKSDPDAAKLKRMVQDIVLAEGGVKPPRNAEEARELYLDAVKEAKKRAAGFVSAPKAKDGVLPVGSSSTTAVPMPKTALEAAKNALAATRGG